MDTSNDTLEKLRAHCLSQGASGIQSLARFFRHLDKNGSESLEAGELKQGLGQLGLEVGEAEVEALCKCWDCDGRGTLDLEEFLRALPPMSQAWEAVTAAAFAKLDQTGNGVVTVDDLRGVYSGRAHSKVCSGEWTEDEALRQFLDNFDTFEKDGQVTLAEFQDYYSGLSTSVDTDSEFVAMCPRLKNLLDHISCRTTAGLAGLITDHIRGPNGHTQFIWLPGTWEARF